MSRQCLFLAAVLTMTGGLGPVERQSIRAQPAEPAKFRIGTYDARAVAVAYAHSEINEKQVKQKVQELKDAEAKGDAKRIKELKTWGEAHQWLLHMQGFAGAPVESMLANMKEQLALTAKAAGVRVIARKADFIDDQVEVVDVTDQVVKLFKPSERTLKMIREVRRRPAMDMADLEQALKEHHHVQPRVSQGADAKTDNEKLQGTWKLVSLEADGEQGPAEIVAKMKLAFKNDTLTFTPGEPDFTNYTFKVDPTTMPPSFDMTHADGTNKGKTKKGIYSLKGDNLTICFGKADQRPKELNSKSGQAMYVLVRVKP